MGPMEVRAVASTALLLDEDEGGYAIERTGYQKHPFKLDIALNPHHPDAEIRTTDNCVTDIDELHEAAGRQCYESWRRPNPSTATNSGYLKNIIDQKHYSLFEHGTITFLCDGIGRDTLLELERHRHISWSVVSTRYVNMFRVPMTMPKAFEKVSEETRRVLEDAFYTEWSRAHVVYQDTYDALVAEGVSHKEAREAARKILPTSTMTTFFVTGNVRTWREIYQKRSDPHADAEVQEFARLVYKELVRLAPNSVQDLEGEARSE